MSFDSPQFWLAVLQIIWIDVLLSGDNAVVIALACRSLPEKQRKWGMILGAGVAVGLRILFAAGISQIMTFPYLKGIGALALFWIAIKLAVPDAEEGHKVDSADTLWRAVRLIAIADAVMSLDNVIAIAAVSKGSVGLLIFGLIVSIPLIIAGSALILSMIERFPVIVWAGAALLGWIAGELIVADPAVIGWIGEATAKSLHYPMAVAGAAFVVIVAFLMLKRRKEAVPERIVED